jgi:hypothetical protein
VEFFTFCESMRCLCCHLLEGIEPARQGHLAIVATQLINDSRLADSAAPLDDAHVLGFKADHVHRDPGRGTDRPSRFASTRGSTRKGSPVVCHATLRQQICPSPSSLDPANRARA